MCHLIQTQGQGKTLDKLKTLVKLEVKAPNTYDALYHQHELFIGACTIFLGKFNVGTQSLKSLLTLVKKHHLHFCNGQHLDTTFSAKFLFAVDKRFQLWLGDCYRAPTHMQVNKNWLNLSPQVEEEVLCSFNIALPPTFTFKDKA